MKRKVSEVIAMLSELPQGTEIAIMPVWYLRGNNIRKRYVGAYRESEGHRAYAILVPDNGGDC